MRVLNVSEAKSVSGGTFGFYGWGRSYYSGWGYGYGRSYYSGWGWGRGYRYGWC